MSATSEIYGADNASRAERGRRIVEFYNSIANGEDTPWSAVVDCIADILHYAAESVANDEDGESTEPAEIVRVALDHCETEIEEEKKA